MRLNYLYISLLLCLFSSIFGQGNRHRHHRAEHFHEIGKIKEALFQLELAYNKDSLQEDLALIIQYYFEIHEYNKSFDWLLAYKAKFKLEDEELKEMYFRLLLTQKKYVEAKSYYEFEKLNTQLSFQDRPIYFTTLKKINIPSTEDYIGAQYYDGKLYYSYHDLEGFKTHYHKIYQTKLHDSLQFEGLFLFKHFPKQHFYIGAPTFIDNRNIIVSENRFQKYKAKANDVPKNDNHLTLVHYQLIDSNWVRKEELPFCAKDYNFTHPFFDTSSQTLYLSSDYSDSFGGLDIYKVSYKSTKWGELTNVGPKVNSLEHEMFPKLHENKLYFSSYGHFTFGGADLFRYDLNSKHSIKNLGPTINSSYDDLDLIFLEKNTLLISNRDLNNDDSFYLIPQLEKKVILQAYYSNGSPISNVKVQFGEKTLGFTDSIGILSIPTVNYNISTLHLSRKELRDTSIVFAPKKDSIKVIYPILPSKHSFHILFAFEKDQFKSSSELDNLIIYLKKNPDHLVYLSGHTDSSGSSSYNLQLSKSRVDNVKAYLIKKGILKDQIISSFWGESKPLKSQFIKNRKDIDRLNRRVVIEY